MRGCRTRCARRDLRVAQAATFNIQGRVEPQAKPDTHSQALRGASALAAPAPAYGRIARIGSLGRMVLGARGGGSLYIASRRIVTRRLRARPSSVRFSVIGR